MVGCTAKGEIMKESSGFVAVFAYFVCKSATAFENGYSKQTHIKEITPDIHAMDFRNGGTSFRYETGGTLKILTSSATTSGTYARQHDNGFCIEMRRDWWDKLPMVKR
jgi:hypothetical protein